MRTYYNDTDPFVCDWLAELMRDGLISGGDIDRRSITDIDPTDLDGYARCHFFAGIGGWDLALQMAGWPDDIEVWTGSCPCQPFSSAGKRLGTDDERHLWPAFSALIAERRPATVFGEQVASSDGRAWLAGVFADLEAMGYRAAGADLCAAGVAAPHRRQRLWWVADTIGESNGGQSRDGVRKASSTSREARKRQRIGSHHWAGGGDSGGLGNTNRAGFREHRGAVAVGPKQSSPELRGGIGHVRCEEPERTVLRRAPAEPSLFPVAHGVSNRVGIMRGAGNAIVPQVAAEFVAAYMEAAA